MHKGGMIADASCQLKLYEENYPAHDLELTVVIFVLKILQTLPIWSKL